MNVWKYLLSIVLAITIPMAGYAWASINERITKVEENKTSIAAMQVEISYLKETMQRIERKLDEELREHHGRNR